MKMFITNAELVGGGWGIRPKLSNYLSNYAWNRQHTNFDDHRIQIAHVYYFDWVSLYFNDLDSVNH